ncbi:MAG: hypothetical protein LW822_11325 [Phycisphaeraceae bacterium]|nr:hypothetical protein [Phycisphaeraceae bacterium]
MIWKMAKFRHTSIVDAIRISEDGSNWKDVLIFIGASKDMAEKVEIENPPSFDLRYGEEVYKFSRGDWAIRIDRDCVYPLDHQSFSESYQAVAD